MRSPIKRNPIRSETDAFWVAMTGIGLIAVSVLIGWLSTPIAGIAAFVVLALLATVAYLRIPDPAARKPLREAALEPNRHGRADARHVLVIANEPLAGEELRRRLLGSNGAKVEVDVLAPVLTSRVHFATTDVDEERRRARERLQRSLAWVREQGLAVRGEIGDIDPTTAIEDELRGFGADEVIVVTGNGEAERWQEREELERLREELDVPIVQVSAS